ncbi:type III restriction/modification enzyme restriction subunit [Hydrogenoanaerobacterium saccharovorans]|uniref:Type III restriction enzyme, res subunit n=1 Tax=Hydrogenoanaerobacterium saccharovorans TaxID=474960 RepID=A0A1H8A0X6_9FIRM|nr:TnsA endonuclease N-terminal domain-containing protein [Hydrogenoanaerobacterium saccharovorans]RPF48282.1 type III restriction/modification enzyme restriction subunit [Hydrogenoanaerobacterium saccharovorans]SEM63564.1 Type III restriction enzyme, res subunit [Hydrogenoanaerobacterium saccharovorans]
MAKIYGDEFSFYNQLCYYYTINCRKIRRNYKDITKKFLDYNDKKFNPSAFLRKPQFEALEMYIFIKEFMNNAQVYEMFNSWRKREGKFSDASYYSITNGQTRIGDVQTEEQTKALFKQMKKVAENYPNYIYALTMGLGKTILMATCIFYEFLLANKYPKDERFCHNALVFAPDKTVLQSLKEIVTFDKSLVLPPEYARVLDANIKVHFLEDTGTTLNTLDNSYFNIIISNTQKIIVKKKHKEDNATDKLFKMSNLLETVYGVDNELDNDSDLMFNQRFQKLCRLSQIGVYVDEAHHMFGSELEKSLRSNATQTSLRSTINLLAKDMSTYGTSVVGCYNYTGTPYVKNQLLPEVVYAYGLKESIINGYLKEVDIKGFENVKNQEFLRAAITNFWNKYSDKTYEGLLPKLAIFASRIEEVETEVRPAVEKILADLGIPLSKILVNVGDASVTSSDDIRNFYNLDVAGSEGSKKQFIILVEKGREGWNCRSLFGVALFRSPKSKIFVLQATMRCLRKITDEQQVASVYLSKENFDTLNDELNKNFNVEIKDLKDSSAKKKVPYKVRVLPPPRYLAVKSIKHEYSLTKKEYSNPINFKVSELDTEKYKAFIYEKAGLARDMSVKTSDADEYREKAKYSALSLAAEISRYLNISPLLASKILKESVDGIEIVLKMVNQYNDVLNDVIIPTIFNTLFEVKCSVATEDKKLLLLKEPQGAGYYEFKGLPELVVTNKDANILKFADKSFHADTYCFDSNPEKECFWQYITSDKVKEIYFTGMFTSNQGDLSIQYYDPESRRIRHYYPDFLAKMDDDTYQLIEVKGDNKIDDIVVKAKADAAHELAVESDMKYVIYAGSTLMSTNVLEGTYSKQEQLLEEN